MKPLPQQYCIYCDHYFESGSDQRCRASLQIDGVSGEKMYSLCSQARGGSHCEFSTTYQEHQLEEVKKELDDMTLQREGIMNAIRWRANYSLPFVAAVLIALVFAGLVGFLANSFAVFTMVAVSGAFVALVIALGVGSVTYYWEQFPTLQNMEFLEEEQAQLKENIRKGSLDLGSLKPALPENEFEPAAQATVIAFEDIAEERSELFQDELYNIDSASDESGNSDNYVLLYSYDPDEWEDPIVPVWIAHNSYEDEDEKQPER